MPAFDSEADTVETHTPEWLMIPERGLYTGVAIFEAVWLLCSCWSCEDRDMLLSPLVELLKLPAVDRAELAMALWESLTDADREETLQLSEAQRVELDRRWREHIENPESALSWADIRSKLLG